jgi:uncharacterized membrane protein YphA (DoxX/SURF4 family)
MLVVLRLSLGWHFYYEGVWKIHHPEFSAEPFLSEAKGPLAPFFYSMLDDVDGAKHLTVDVDDSGSLLLNAKGKPAVKAESTLTAWEEFKDRVASRYGLSEQQIAQADDLFGRYKTALNSYLDDNAEEIAGYLDSLNRYRQEVAQGGNGADYYKKRMWERQHGPQSWPGMPEPLRKQIKGWLTQIGKMGEEFKGGMWALLDEEQQQRGYFKASWNPFQWSRTEQINFAVTYGLTAIGLCLMLGLFTRLAALGGAAFMCFVVLSQLPWPTIYPLPGPESGHSMGVDKNVIEMVALLLVATTAAGRWGGLDGILYHWLPFPLGVRKKKQQQQESQEA